MLPVDLSLLPASPFTDAGWSHLLLVQDEILSESGIPRLLAAVRHEGSGESICFSLTTFGDSSILPSGVDPDWQEKFSWAAIESSEKPQWQFARSGMLFYDASCRWVGIYTEDDLVVVGGEPDIISRLETLCGGRHALRRRVVAYISSSRALSQSSYLKRLIDL